MPFVFKNLALLLSISAVFAADKETPFKASPAATYASHQSNAQITIGVDPYVTNDKVQVAFGKLEPSQFGILPVLVVIQNDSKQAIRLDRIKVEYVGPLIIRPRGKVYPFVRQRKLNGAVPIAAACKPFSVTCPPKRHSITPA